MCLFPLAQQQTMKDEPNTEARGESTILLDKVESVATGSLASGGTSRQNTESGPSKRTQNEPLKEERMEVGVVRVRCTWFQRYFQRIFEVAARGDHKALSNLLTNCTTEVHSIDSKGNTALHHAVASACRKGDRDDSLYRCIDLLMSCEKMNVNMPNKKGYTPIRLAVHHLHRTCVEHMLQPSLAKRLHLDYYPGDRESTVREIIVELYPELQPLLPTPLMEDMASSQRDINLLRALQREDYKFFRENIFYFPNYNRWYDEPYHSTLLEIACQMKNRQQFVKILLDNGADPNITNRVTGMPLIHATARSGNFEVLQLLLEKEGIDASLKDNEKRTILHWLAGVSEGKSNDKEKIEECFNLLPDSNYIRKKGIDDRDSLGNNPLYITVESGIRDRAKLLLSKGADFRVLESGSKILLPDSVSIVEKILDDCLQDNKKPLTSKDLQLKLNYQLLMDIVPRIAESKFHRDLLTHPVLSTFLTIKWEKFRLIFFVDMVFYILFLYFLTTHILLSEQYNTLNDGGAAGNTIHPFIFDDSNKTSGMNESNFTSQPNSNSLRFLQILLMFCLFLLSLRKVAQLIVRPWFYGKLLQYWLEILLIISTFISCSGVVESAEVKLHSSAVALLLGWFELLMLLGRLPLLSVQHEMLRTVCWTFLSFMVGYGTLLIAFALSFCVVFKQSSEYGYDEMFGNTFLSLLKTIVMFAGEFEASSLPFDNLPYTSHVIFLLFVVLVAIVLLNLFGVAINDTGLIRNDAVMLELAARAKLISRIERLVNALPQFNAYTTFLKRSVELKEKLFVIYPNRRNRTGSYALLTLLRINSEQRRFVRKKKLVHFQRSGACLQRNFPHWNVDRKVWEKN